MMKEFANIDMRIMQEEISVPVGVFEGFQEIVLDVLIGMASVDEGDVDLRQPKVVVGREELIAPQLVMRDQVLHLKESEMLPDLLGIIPFPGAAHGLEGAVFEDRVSRVYKGHHPLVVVSQAERETDEAETETGADDEDVFGAKSPYEPVVEESEAKVQAGGLFIVPERPGILEDVLQKLCVQTQSLHAVVPSLLMDVSVLYEPLF